MGLRRNACLQCQRHGGQHGLFVMVQDERQDLDHFPVTARIAQQMPLQPLEGLGQFEERRAVAQGARFALDHRQIMPPVIDGVAGAIMGSVDDALMLAYHLSFRHDQEATGIDPQADRPIGEGCWHAVAIALQVNQAGRRDALAMFDKAVEGPAHRHQTFHLVGTVLDLLKKQSALPVHVPTDMDQLEPNHIYVGGPDDMITIEGGHVRIRPAAEPVGHRGTIDSMLISLAEQAHDRTIAVLLAGLGGEGTAGVTATKKFGGLSIAELVDGGLQDDAGTGPFGVVDLRLPVGQIAAQIALYAANLDGRAKARRARRCRTRSRRR